MIHHGDCLEVMATFDAESIDAIVTDPPYGLEFMGKAWDKIDVRQPGDATYQSVDNPYGRSKVRHGAAPSYGVSSSRAQQDWHEAWAREAFRVAKPGAHLLAFGGTRTYHRLAAAIEDAGWEIRDTLVWAYASGFPKSHNLTGEREGWGTSLKPAWEPIVMARKPLRGTVARNVTEYGTGALNIDGCRIGLAQSEDPEKLRLRSGGSGDQLGQHGIYSTGLPSDGQGWDNTKGRWPANVILTDPIFDGDTPGVVGGGEDVGGGVGRRGKAGSPNIEGWGFQQTGEVMGPRDSGTYSRFFLVPKSARSDREPVISPLRADSSRHNVHPTVKPTDLMRHLVRLVTPPGGVVLDPFLGSGTTALAAEMEGFEWVGIERAAEYVAIAEARLNGTQKGLGLA